MNMWESEVEALVRQFPDIFPSDLGSQGNPNFSVGLSQPTESTAEISAERIAMEKTEQERYGDLLADVKFLRSRDFSVVLDAVDDDGLPTLLCDGRPTTATQLREKAARERRLLALPTLHLL